MRDQRPVRSLSSPVFLNLTRHVEARNVLEAMIAHSDNTATDVALAAVGVASVRALIAEAGLGADADSRSRRAGCSPTGRGAGGVDLAGKACSAGAQPTAGRQRAPGDQ